MLLIMLLPPLMATPALTDYYVQSGDVVEISVSGSPELLRRMMISLDGKVYFPLLGEVSVAGLSLAQLRQKLHDLLVAKHAFDNPDVTVDIAEYRPIYVTGHVFKPGAYPYRPGMTVRDAIALAGGYGRSGLGNSFEARDQYGSLSIKFVRLQIHTARLRAEFAGGTEIELNSLQPGGVTTSVLSEFVSMEAQQLRMDQADFEKEKTHLARLIDETQDQISALLAEQAQQQLALSQEQKEADRAQGLFDKSLVPIARVEDEQRILSSSKTRLFEVKARTAQARRDLEDYTRRLQKLSDQRKIDIMQRLEAATGELATVTVDLAALGENVRYIGAKNPQRLTDGSEVWDLVIFRKNQQRVAAGKDTNLLPGDALEITGETASGPPELTLRGDLPDLAASVSKKGQSRFGSQAEIPRATVPPADIDAVGQLDAMHPADEKLAVMTAPEEAASIVAAAPVALAPATTPTVAPPAPAPLEEATQIAAAAPSALAPGTAPTVAMFGPATPPAEPRASTLNISAAEISAHLARGDSLFGVGDITSARLYYQRAADAGDAQAAQRLGETYDPLFLVLARLNWVRGDPAVAASWYRRARDLGSAEAENLLNSVHTN
jgi:polysaccharide biosynthesis/export protein